MLKEQVTEISGWPHRMATIESVGIQNYQTPEICSFSHFKDNKKTKKNRFRKLKETAANINHLKIKTSNVSKLLKKKGNTRPEYPTNIACQIRNIQNNLAPPDPSIYGKNPIEQKKANKQNKTILNHPQPLSKCRVSSQKQAFSCLPNAISTLNLYDKLHNEIEYRSRSLNSSLKEKILSKNPKRHCQIKQIMSKEKDTKQKYSKCIHCGKLMESGSKVAILTQNHLKKIQIENCVNCVFEKRSRQMLKQQKQFSVYLRKRYKASKKYHQSSNKLLKTLQTSNKQISPKIFSIPKQEISLPFCDKGQKDKKSFKLKNQRISREERSHSLKITKYISLYNCFD